MKIIKEKKIQFVICLMVVLFLVNTAYAIEYTYTDLLPLGWNNGSASSADINNSGVVVGAGYDASNIRKGFIYDSGSYTELFPTGWREAWTNDINDNSIVVGAGILPGQSIGQNLSRGFIYDNGSYTYLLPPGAKESEAFGINNSGVVVGWSKGIDPNDFGRAFIYNNGTYTELLPPDYSTSIAYGINDNGDIIGWGWGDHVSHQAFLYHNGVFTDILLPGYSDSFAFDLNNNGEVVGRAYNNNNYVGFLYSNGEYTQLRSYSDASGINDNGVVVGDGFVYDNGSYAVIDGSAKDINNTGVIVGIRYGGTSNERAYMATPVTSPPVVPEPISVILFVTGGTLLAGRSYLKKR